jgi:hypothetical protein
MPEYQRPPRLSRQRSRTRIRRVGDAFQTPGSGYEDVTKYTAGSIESVASTNYTFTSPKQVALVTTGASNRTITLPLASTYEGVIVTIRKVDTGAGAVVITPNAADDHENGETSLYLYTPYSGVRLLASGTTWYVVSQAAMSWSLNGAVTTITDADHTIAAPETLILFSTGASTRTATLPSAALYTGVPILIKKIDAGAGNVTISRAGSDLIDGATSKSITAQYKSYTLLPEGTTWHIIAST